MYFYVLTAILVSASYQLTLTFLSLEHVASRRSSGEKAQQSTSSSWAWISVSFSPEVLLNTWEQRCDDGSYTTVRILLYLLFSCGNYSRFRYLNLKVDHFGGNDPLMIISLHFCRNINTITKDTCTHYTVYFKWLQSLFYSCKHLATKVDCLSNFPVFSLHGNDLAFIISITHREMLKENKSAWIP